MRRYRLTIGDKVFEVEVVAVRGELARVLVNGRPYEVKIGPAAAPQPGAAPTPAPAKAAAAPPPPPTAPPPAVEVPAGLGTVTAPMPGSILEVLVKAGDRVQAGDTVVKLEAMKMENDLRVPVSGVVSEIKVGKGSNVSVGEVLLVVSED